MMNFFSPLGSGIGFVGFHVHAFFALLAVIGFALVIVWGARFATRAQLSSAITWFLAIGILGAIITSPLVGAGFRSMMGAGGPGSWIDDLDEDDRTEIRDFRRTMMRTPRSSSGSSLRP